MSTSMRHAVIAAAIAAVAFVAGIGSAALAAEVGVEFPGLALGQWFQAR